MACGTGAGTAAFSINAGNAVANGCFHHARSIIGFDFSSRSAVSGHEDNFCHCQFLRTLHGAIDSFCSDFLEGNNRLLEYLAEADTV
jgi:hypothetical protein